MIRNTLFFLHLPRLIHPPDNFTDTCNCDPKSYQGKLLKWRWPGRQTEGDVPERENSIVIGMDVWECLSWQSEAEEGKNKELNMTLERKNESKALLYVILRSWDMRGDESSQKCLARNIKLLCLEFEKSLCWLWGRWIRAGIGWRHGGQLRGPCYILLSKDDEDLDCWDFFFI